MGGGRPSRRVAARAPRGGRFRRRFRRRFSSNGSRTCPDAWRPDLPRGIFIPYANGNTPPEVPIDTLTLLGIAVGLAMDAFAVAIATGIVLGTVSGRQTFRLAFHFGLFQFLMPVIGYLAGMSVEGYIKGYDHWLAFTLLAYIGGKMVYEGGWGGGGGRGGKTGPPRGESPSSSCRWRPASTRWRSGSASACSATGGLST